MNVVPEVKEGETYIGAIIKADGTGNHIILLPGDIVKPSWDESMEWAKSIGGDLPDRAEQALMFSDHKYLFKKDWYWSNTLNVDASYCAWSQHFRHGYQGNNSWSDQCRSRAVRRLPI
jgi:hypothetical protein